MDPREIYLPEVSTVVVVDWKTRTHRRHPIVQQSSNKHHVLLPLCRVHSYIASQHTAGSISVAGNAKGIQERAVLGRTQQES